MGTVVGIDPGETTGMCVFRSGEFISGQEATSYEDIRAFIERYQPDFVVMESFIPTRRGGGIQTLKTIGVVEYICAVLGILAHMQSPSILQGTRITGHHRSPHVRAAIAHVTHFLAKGRKEDHDPPR